MTFGEYVKNRRGALGLSLRQFCLRHRVDASNWSKLERGILPPPQHDKLREYAEHLEIGEGSGEWYVFFDLAAAETGRLPEDLQGQELLKKMPVFFRTLRESAKDGGSDSEQFLEELKRKIRDA